MASSTPTHGLDDTEYDSESSETRSDQETTSLTFISADPQNQIMPQIDMLSTVTTFGYQWVLRNHIDATKLATTGAYNVEKYIPVFVHDCLMMPGSLASVLGKNSSLDISHRMTPALLRGYRTLPNPTDNLPELISGRGPTNGVHGMIVFGQGRKGRHRVSNHYRTMGRRTKVQVEIDVTIPVEDDSSLHDTNRTKVQRTQIWAYAWLSTTIDPANVDSKSVQENWNLDDYLTGKYECSLE